MLIVGFIIAQIVIFAVIIIVLKRLIFDDTTSAINRITRLDSMNREKEKMLMQKLEETEKYLSKRKNELIDEEKSVKQEANRAALQLQEDIIKRAKAEAGDIIKKAQESRERMRLDAVIEAEAKIIDMCREVLGRVLSSVARAQINEQIIAEFLKEFEEADIARVGRDVKVIEIYTARPIADETRKIIAKMLLNKLGREVELDIKEDSRLLGGVVLKFGTMVIDGSLYERLKECAEKMKDELAWKYTV